MLYRKRVQFRGTRIRKPFLREETDHLILYRQKAVLYGETDGRSRESLADRPAYMQFIRAVAGVPALVNDLAVLRNHQAVKFVGSTECHPGKDGVEPGGVDPAVRIARKRDIRRLRAAASHQQD